MSGIARGGLIVVHAGPGCGKTTALEAWQDAYQTTAFLDTDDFLPHRDAACAWSRDAARQWTEDLATMSARLMRRISALLAGSERPLPVQNVVLLTNLMESVFWRYVPAPAFTFWRPYSDVDHGELKGIGIKEYKQWTEDYRGRLAIWWPDATRVFLGCGSYLADYDGPIMLGLETARIAQNDPTVQPYRWPMTKGI